MSSFGLPIIGESTWDNKLFQPQRFMDLETISTYRYDVTIVWLDFKMDPSDRKTQSLLNLLNDRVQLFNNASNCIDYLRECRETTLFIVSGKCAEEYLHSIHSLSSIDSIIIYCASPEKYRHLINDHYSKVLACIASEIELIQCVHHWIDLKCQTHFYIWDHQIDYSQELTRQMALFLANYLLPKCIENQAYGKRKEEMLKISQAYYAQHPLESNHIQEFELTYTPDDAINWYTRNSFVHKLINRALRSFDIIKLRAIAFYIRDLRLQLRQCCLKTDLKQISTVYHGLAMTQTDIDRIQATPIGSYISMNGFLSTSRNCAIALAFAKKKQNTLSQLLCNVLLEIRINTEKSPIICADIERWSAFPDEGEVIFDLGTIFCLQNVINEKADDIQLHVIKLIPATHTDYDSIQKTVKEVKHQFKEQVNSGEQTSLIGKLLNVKNSLYEQPKKLNDYGPTFSLFRTAFNTLWNTSQDHYKHLFVEPFSFAKQIYQVLHSQYNRMEKSDNMTINESIQIDEILLARFEPILFFHLNEELMKQERTNLSTVFQLQYRRFITKHLAPIETEENLNEYYYIYYISSELPGFMKEHPRIKFYQLQWPSETENEGLIRIKIIERLKSQLLHDLGMFYSEQAKSLSVEGEKQLICKALRKKGAKCYELLAEEYQKIIQRYPDI